MNAMNRYTFVIHVHPDGPSTLENLSTCERVPLADLDAVGAQIERWLAVADGHAENATPGRSYDPCPEPKGHHAQADQ